jgi:antitoxin VapB
MNARIPAKALKAQSPVETTVFQSGNSQAVRLPKEFRFSTKQITIERRGDEVVLRAKKPTVAELLRDLPALSTQECAEWDKAMALIDETPAQEREWAAMFLNKGAAK